MFSIRLQSPSESKDKNGQFTEASGRIQIGDFTENFKAPLSFWGELEYHRSWRQSFEVLNRSEGSTSCLMTSMTDPHTSNFLVSWPMYRVGEEVYFQNAIIFLDEIEGDFNPAAPWGYIRPRQTMDEDGNKISEWSTSLKSLREFFEL